MRCIAGVEQGEPRAVQENPVEVVVVEVFSFLAGITAEVEQTLVFVDFDDATSAERAGGDGVLKLAVPTVEVEVAPATALAPPDQLVAVLQVAHTLGADVGTLEALFNQSCAL